jgi:hypothetical protein
VSWFLLTVFSHVYSENCEQKAEQEGLKNLQFAEKRSTCNVGGKGSMADEEIRKPSTLHWHNRKDILRASQ